MEFLRSKATQTAINTYIEEQIPTPTSKTENMAMLIHSVELIPLSLVDTTPTNADSVSVHLARKSSTFTLTLSNPDLIAYFNAVTALNAIFNGVSIRGQQKTTFDPPLLYPKANLYLGMNTVGMATVKYAECKIGYTLEKVSREDFISALVE